MFFRFLPMGKFNKTRFEPNWTTFVNPAFSVAWKSPPKMVAWNRNCKIRSQGCFFATPRWGKLKKRVLNAIGGPSSTQRFCAAWKSPPKMVAWNWNFKIRSQGCFFVSPRWGNLKKRVLNAIGPLSWTRLFPVLGKAHPKWWHETEIVKFDPKAVFSLRPDGESWKNAFWTEFDDLRYPSVFALLGKAHPKWWHETEILKFDPKGVFSFPPDGEI